MKRLTLAVAACVATACTPASDAPTASTDKPEAATAAHDMAAHEGMADASAPAAGDSAATQGFKASMFGMMTDAPAYGGDADVDFMKQMRGHHVAAVAMSKVELEHGKDAEARALAETVIAAQEREIALIDRWLASRAA